MKIITGQFLNPLGDPAAGATVNFVLSQPENTSVGIITRERISAILDANGNLPAGFELYGNDEFYTAGSWYNITVVDPVFGRVLYENVAIVGNSPISLPSLTPIIVR
jgi:hypothetical protein